MGGAGKIPQTQYVHVWNYQGLKKAVDLKKGLSTESKEGHRKTLGKVGGLNDAYFKWKTKKGGQGSDGRSDAGISGDGKRKSRKAEKRRMAL